MPWLVLLLLLSACETEESPPRVPFKLGAQPAANVTNESGGTPAEPVAAQFEADTDHPLVEQKPTPFLRARSVLSVDLDQDQDRDALALVSDPAQVVALAVSLREGDAFGAPQILPGFGLAAGCELTLAKLSAVSANKGVATLGARCGEPKKAAAQRELLFALESKPFLLEQIEIVPSSEGSAPAVSLSFSQADSDQDGHDDVLVDVSLPGAATPVTERLVLLDRSPALTFDAQAFEIALAARAERAKELLKKSPDEAVTEAQAVMSLWSALCRAADQPSVLVSGKPGLPCLASRATASARATFISAHATRGHLREAVDAYVTLSLTETSESKAALAEATKAMGRLKPTVKATLTQGPELAVGASDPSIELPRARFISETLLLLNRPAAAIYDLAAQTETPAAPASVRVLDPAGALVLAGFERRCAGITLRIERASTEGPSAQSNVVSTPVALGRSFSPDCVDTPQSVHRDAAGFRVLGWAPQGLLLARGSEVRLVPLGLDGKAAGEARALDAATPLPAPLPLGRATADGARYAWLTPFGVVVFSGQNRGPDLIRPTGWDGIAASATDVAISPAGGQLAVLSGGRCHLLKRDVAP